MKFKMFIAFAFTLLAGTTFAQKTFKSCYVQGDECFCVTYEESQSQSVIQNNCTGKHIVFNSPTNRSPKNLPRLGSNPQFGTLRNYTTTQEVYNHLKKTYTQNEKGNAAELDKLWNAMGYNGFNDPTFTVDKVAPIFYDAGVSGMLGAGGNTYLFASIAPGTDQKFKGYQIASVNGCDVTIMEICGNAFYPSTSPRNVSSTGGMVSSGNKIVSTKSAKINFPAGYTAENSTVTTYMENGECKLRICRKPEGSKGKEAVVVTNLAHNQQFGSMASLKTTDEVYARLQSLYKENKKGNRAELDRLWKSIGYNGLNDKRFTTSSINIVRYDGGVAAVMGGGEHQYMYSEIATKDYDALRGFTIKALNDKCDLTIIDVCGNALYCPEPMNCQTVPCSACN